MSDIEHAYGNGETQDATADLYVSYLNRLCDSYTEPENIISQYLNDTEAHYRAAVNRITIRKTAELNHTEPQGQES